MWGTSSARTSKPRWSRRLRRHRAASGLDAMNNRTAGLSAHRSRSGRFVGCFCGGLALGSVRCRGARSVGLPEKIAADIRLVGFWRSLSGPCYGPLRTSICIVIRQPSAQMILRPISAVLADIRSQRTMPSACGGALPAGLALSTEPASVPVSFRPPGCSPTTDLARFGSAVQRLSRAASRSVTGSAVLVHTADRGEHFPVRKRPQDHPRPG